jgi:GDP/UDP-N,N'-diacetylbacillosamine 2-epimerase (hydrolysing)
MKVLFVTGSRSEWGYIKPILDILKKKRIKTDICLTNMHLLDSFGSSINEVKKDGFKTNEKIYMALDGYNTYTMTKSLGVFMISFTDMLLRIKPDWVVIAGDRAESFTACVVSAYNNIATAHIQAGELSGNIDGQSRHAIGKFAHLHFCANKEFSNRLKKMGEQEFRIKTVGSPQLDELNFINNENKKKKFFEELNIEKLKGYLLVVYHSVTEEFYKTEKNFNIFLESLKKISLPKIWILPNNDAGSSVIKSNILKKRTNDIFIFDNINREKYLYILKHASCIVGNSSSGIIEAPTFKVPCVNVGRRQNKRLRAKNVIDILTYDKDKIAKAINKAISIKFRKSIHNIKNPYGDGKSSNKIVEHLLNTKIDKDLFFKEITY